MTTPTEENLFNRALALPASDRATFLDQACAGNAPLRVAVDELLRLHTEADGFLDTPAPEAAVTVALSAVRPEAGAGDMIGRYKLLQQIGEGGCGVVYMAEQEQPVRRRVALKVIKLGMDTKAVIARFEAERQALAIMDHPNIAKVLDAGATDTGRPFFVMELVRGVPITKYCDEQNLATAARLELFSQVCHAIHHAHQKGIIHRDVKPSNILVTLHDGEAVPKVIDFGIAKATQGRLTDQTLFTAFEQFIGTPAYMSPEQAEMSGLDIDTRSDIYSLGVLLYELLTGKPPFDPKTFLSAGLDEMRRIIREVEPPKPSTRLDTLAAVDRSTVAKLRGTVSTQLTHLLAGDLDWIVMKALEKNRTRRYESASAFAADIQRHLRHEPVIARPPSTAYLLQKLIRRHQLAFVAGSAVAAALVLGLGFSTWSFLQEKKARANEAAQRVQAETNEKKAKLEAIKSEQAFKFVAGMLQGVGPSVAAGRDTALLREILDKTVRRLGKELQDQPDVEMNLRSILAEVYLDLGDVVKAETMVREALAQAEKLHGREHPDVAGALITLGLVRLTQGQCAEAEKLTQEALAILQKSPGDQTEKRVVAHYVMGAAQLKQDHLVEAEASHRAALALALKNPDEENSNRIELQLSLGDVLQRQGRLVESEPLIRDGLAAQRRRYGPDHPRVAQSLLVLQNALQAQGKLSEASAMLRDAIAILTKSFGPEHPFVVTLFLNQAQLLQQENRIAEAEALLRQTLILHKKVLGPQHDTVANTLIQLSQLLQRQGQSAEAETLQREAMAIKEKIVGEELAEAGRKMGRAMAAIQQGKAVEAEATLREILLVVDKTGRGSPEVLRARMTLAQVIFQQRRPAEAERFAREAVTDTRQAFGEKSARLGEPLSLLGRMLHAQGKLAETEAVLRDALVVARAQTSAPGVAESLFLLTALKIEQGDLAAADALAGEAVTMMREVPEGRRGGGINSVDGLINDLRTYGKVSEAMAVQRRMLDYLRQLEGPQSMAVAMALPRLATQLNKEGQFAEAEPLAREGWLLRQKLMPAADWGTAGAQSVHGQSLVGLKKYSEAEPVLLAALAGIEQNANAVTKTSAGWKDRQRTSIALLVQLYEATNQPAKAAEWKQKAAASAAPASPPATAK